MKIIKHGSTQKKRVRDVDVYLNMTKVIFQHEK